MSCQNNGINKNFDGPSDSYGNLSDSPLFAYNTNAYQQSGHHAGLSDTCRSDWRVTINNNDNHDSGGFRLDRNRATGSRVLRTTKGVVRKEMHQVPALLLPLLLLFIPSPTLTQTQVRKERGNENHFRLQIQVYR